MVLEVERVRIIVPVQLGTSRLVDVTGKPETVENFVDDHGHEVDLARTRRLVEAVVPSESVGRVRGRTADAVVRVEGRVDLVLGRRSVVSDKMVDECRGVPDIAEAIHQVASGAAQDCAGRVARQRVEFCAHDHVEIQINFGCHDVGSIFERGDALASAGGGGVASHGRYGRRVVQALVHRVIVLDDDRLGRGRTRRDNKRQKQGAKDHGQPLAAPPGSVGISHN